MWMCFNDARDMAGGVYIIWIHIVGASSQRDSKRHCGSVYTTSLAAMDKLSETVVIETETLISRGLNLKRSIDILYHRPYVPFLVKNT